MSEEIKKHTPGPWRWSNEYQARDLSDTWSLIDSNGYGILSCDGDCNSPQHLNKADALLIQKAPLLLEALESIADYWNQDRNDEAMFDACCHAIDTARAVIAAATEES